MIKMSVCSPGRGLSTSAYALRLIHPEKSKVSFGLSFALLCLVLSASSISAQTRLKHVTVKPEERVRRVNDEPSSAMSQGQREDTRQAERPPLVRKTAIIYAPRNVNQKVENTTLTNDFVIISEASAADMARSARANKAATASANIPSIWPVIGPLRSGVGVRRNPFGGLSLEVHKGQDISAPTGTPVNVTADGIVIRAEWIKGYGNGIYVDHGNGITTRYGHLSRIDVVVGQTLKRGDHLGLVGSTGRSTGPHLHYEVRINGEPVSPLSYLPSIAAPPAAQ
jgi:murein DD-endopeptidase MepM/ murein hydrolase activator NlpD